MPSFQSRRWCFTINNYTSADETIVQAFPYAYLVYGREKGEQGTPHLQGYVEFSKRMTLSGCKLLHTTAHWESAKGTSHEASTYCKKDQDFFEDGILAPERQGKRTDLERLRDAINDGERNPKRLRQEYSAALKYPSVVRQLLIDTRPKPKCPDICLYEWQKPFVALVQLDPHPRQIWFVVDPKGNGGKSTFCTYLEALHDNVQVMKPGRKMDMAYDFIEETRILLMDCPRSRADVLQYDFLEEVKDGRVFSTKYEPVTKRPGPCHVIVFMNEPPDRTKLSLDRFQEVSL